MNTSNSPPKDHWTVDAVLARPDYEKDYSAKQDYPVSLTGINIAVLSGPDSGPQQNPITALDVLMGFDDTTAAGMGGPEGGYGPHYEHELYKFLLATRQTIAAAPAAFIQATGGNPTDTIAMLDYAIRYWYTDHREEALGQLEKNEEAINTLAGLGAFNAVQISGANESELYGDDDAHEVAGLGRAKRKRKPSKFFSGLKKAVKKVKIGKALVRFNPATIAIRNGFLLALKLNLGKMSEKMKWAYATPQQIAAKRVSPALVAAAKRAVEKVEKMFSKIGGKTANMRKAILSARKGRLNGTEELGALPVAGVAAALPFIKVVMDVLKKAGLFKAGESASLTADGGGETGIQRLSPDEDESQYPPDYAPESLPATYAQSYTPATTDAEAAGESGVDGLGAVFSGVKTFFQGNPGMALALTAGGMYLLYKATESKDTDGHAPSSLGSLHTHQRSRRKGTAKASQPPTFHLH